MDTSNVKKPKLFTLLLSLVTALAITITPAIAIAPPAVAATATKPFTKIKPPVVAGSPYLGKTLSVIVDPWTPATTGGTFQWMRNGKPIAGAIRTSYVLTTQDVGHKVSVRYVGTRSGYTSTATNSAMLTISNKIATINARPTISGKTEVASTLTAIAPAYQPSNATLAWQWKRDGVNVSGATAKTYPLKEADQGKVITVSLSISAAGYLPASITSLGTVKITAKPVVPTPTATPKPTSTPKPTPVPTSTPKPTTPPVATNPEERVFQLVNIERAKAGVPPLKRNAVIDNTSRTYAGILSRSSTFQHSGNDWRSANIPAGWKTNAENIAAGYFTPEEVMAGWMASPGHKANILNPTLTDIGVGMVYDPNATYKYYWVQIFARY